MATGALPVEKLRNYLRQLPAGARALLTAELERALLRGEEIPGGDLLLQEVRSAVRTAGEPVARADESARAFFRVVEPFLVDDELTHKQSGRIARAAVSPLWNWIGRDLLPQETKSYSEEIGRAVAADDAAECERLSEEFQGRVIEAIQAAFAVVKGDDKARRKMLGQIGTPKAFEDAHDLCTILSGRMTLDLIANRLPGHVYNFADANLENAKTLLDTLLASQRELMPYALILVMGRLSAPWQLIRLAVMDVESDDVTRIATSHFATAVTIVLGDIERMVGELRQDLKRGETVAVTSLLKCVHDSARGLRTELDLAASDSAWSRQLAAIRSEISSALTTEIESMPGRVRRLLRPGAPSGVVRGSALDPDEVAEVEALVGFVGACRHYASELAINEVTLRTYHDVQAYLETGTQTLLDGLRSAPESERPFRQAQIDAAVRFCAKVFGKEYASLLGKAAEVAAHTAVTAQADRKALAKA
jgi:hypothetical protein